jgi:predicted TPR repeat methyltransferase/uncharacterized coiled-coil protein SlyX
MTAASPAAAAPRPEPLGPAVDAFHRRDLASAAAHCRAILHGEPGRVDALNLLGAAEGEQGNVEAAVEIFERALALQPGHQGALINLAMALTLAGRDDDALVQVERVLALAPGDAQALHVRGALHRRQGRLLEAMTSLDASLAADPQQADVHFERGQLLAELADIGLPRRAEAVAALRRAIELGGDEALISFWLASMGADRAPPAPPQAFVAQMFDRYADRFDQHLVDELAYRGPQLVADEARRRAAAQVPEVLDLGCGTGLCGPLLRPLAGRLVGVDLSGRMLAKAEARGIYDELVQADIVEHLETLTGSVDLIVAADVLIYLGNLAPLFAAAQGALRPGGAFVFTVESHDGDGFRLLDTRRYAHGDGYLRALAALHGLDVETLAPAVLRTQHGEDVQGRVVTLQLPLPAEPAAAPADLVEARLVDLEIKASWAEDTLDRLNQVIVRQQQQIDALGRELARWREQAPSAGTPPGSLRDELPPHY